MKKNLKKSFITKASAYVFICVILNVMTSCSQNVLEVQNNSDGPSPKFSITEPVYKSNSEDSRCAIGGVYFDFYNKASCDVVFMEVRLNVYDKKTRKNAFTGHGTIVSGNECHVKVGAKKNMCVPLDDFITVISDAGYLIDQFFISRIEYSDGSVYKDIFGTYAASGGE